MSREYTKLEARSGRSPPCDHGIAIIVVGDEFSRSALKSILRSDKRVAEVIEAGSVDESIKKLTKRMDVRFAIL